MHPRSDLWPCFEIVFHVTNRGYFSSLGLRAVVSDWVDRELGVVTVVELERTDWDELAEVIEGVVEELEPDCSRLTLGTLIF